ncbi:MAG: hypothetical protein ABUK15_07365 [Anaerolineales bacterium]
MTIRQVLLNGSGTSGDGTTWNDLSDATSAYIAQAGLSAAVNASSPGDIVYVKGSDTASASTLTMGNITLADAQNPVQILGCIAGTTNNQGSIVSSDLVPGLRNGSATRAYDQTAGNAPPVITLAGASGDILFKSGYWYGIRFKSADDLRFNSSVNGSLMVEECHFEIHGSNVMYFNPQVGHFRSLNCQFKALTTSSLAVQGGYGRVIGGIFDVDHTTSIFNSISVGLHGDWRFEDCDFSLSDPTLLKLANLTLGAVFNNCLMPTSWALTGGTAIGPYRFEAYGCDDTTGLTTGGSEQQMNIETQHGTIVTETTVVHDSPADDGATGGISWDMSTFANGTALSVAGLESPWMYIWVEGTGAAQVLTLKFCSDTGNTRATNWISSETWMEVEFPSASGTSQYDRDTTVANLLATGSTVTDGVDAEWDAAAGVRAQELSTSISPDYEGMLRCRVVFAPGPNAETIYVRPLPVLS